MPVIWCKTWYRSNSYCDHKNCLNRDVSTVSLLKWKKIESHFETWSSDAQRINLIFVAQSFVANFVRYISNQILFKLVFISHCYHESPRGELFLKHSVVLNQYQRVTDRQTDRQTYRWTRRLWLRRAQLRSSAKMNGTPLGYAASCRKWQTTSRARRT